VVREEERRGTYIYLLIERPKGYDETRTSAN